MEAIPLDDGDLRWVFPHLRDCAEVGDLVRAADAEIRLLAGHLGVRAGWTGSGIEFHRYDRGQVSLCGYAGTGGVLFVTGLRSPHPAGRDTGWEVEGEITVRCDARVDCGQHLVEEVPVQRSGAPVPAARALVAAATWLRERGTAEPLEAWRRRDVRRGHDDRR